MEAEIKLYLFGAPRLELNGMPAEFSSRRALAAFAYLALTKSAHSRESLATLLWPDADPKYSRARLRRMLYDIKQVVGKDIIQTRFDAVGLASEANIWIDVEVFRKAAVSVEEKENDLGGQTLEDLRQASELAVGDFMEGFSLPDSLVFDDWQFYERESLRKVLEIILEQLCNHYSKIANYPLATQTAQRRLSLDRLNEAAVRQLMSILASAGQQSAALREYKLLIQSLKDVYDQEPENETKELYESIKKLQFAPKRQLEENTESKSRGLDIVSPPHNLPAPGSALVGRKSVLDEICKTMISSDVRLITLTGPGGVGKTRLALQALYSILDDNSGKNKFSNGIFFVPLAPVSTGKGITSAAASAMNLPLFREAADAEEQFIASLQGRQILLLFDNLEHLLEDMDSTLLISHILTAAPAVKIIVTSRSRLDMHKEKVIQIGGLDLPDDDLAIPNETGILSYSAVKFFVECARRSLPSFEITPESTPHILHICRMVDGFPLGIELAAAWLPILSPSEIAGEIEKSLDFLDADWRDVPERQKSLRAVFDASWRLLSAKEQDTLRLLSIFKGSFSRQGAEFVCSIEIKDLLRLSGKSWISHQYQGRYQIHELLRQYAYEKLEEDPDALKKAWRRFTEYYTNFLIQHGELMKGPMQGASFKAIKEEYQNIRRAWFKLIEKNNFTALIKMQYGLVRESMGTGRAFETLSLLEAAHQRLLETVPIDPVISTILQTPKLVLLAGLYIYDSLDSPSDEDLETLRSVWDRANSFSEDMGYWYILLAYQYGRSIDRLEAIKKLEAALLWLQEKNNDWERAAALAAKASLLSLVGNYEEAGKCLYSAIDLQRETGDYIQCALSLHLAGLIATRRGEFDQGEKYLKEGLDLVKKSGEVSFRIPLIGTLAGLYLKKGQFELAFQQLELQGKIAKEINNPFMEAAVYSTYSYEAVRYGDMDLALEKRRWSTDLFEKLNANHYAAWSYWELGEWFRVDGNLSEAERWYQAALVIFEELGITSGKAYYERGMGDLALMKAHYEEARLHFTKSLSPALEPLHEWLVSYVYIGLSKAEIGLKMPDEAQKHLTNAVNIAFRTGNSGLILAALAGFALLHLLRGRHKEAAILSSFIINHHATWRETRRQGKNTLEQALLIIPETMVRQIEKEASLLDIPHLVDQLTSDTQFMQN